ncbi:DUF4129 domain-containing protein [Babesia caballi]|uniref:DUF4129 domain-containing protein n=1 Tax=Babesia caballi TaxID=5871 RepID=A0AAV4LTA7_BABCB|nr:DUF4129 domain-containing protein [Babesia caballi]
MERNLIREPGNHRKGSFWNLLWLVLWYCFVSSHVAGLSAEHPKSAANCAVLGLSSLALVARGASEGHRARGCGLEGWNLRDAAAQGGKSQRPRLAFLASQRDATGGHWRQCGSDITKHHRNVLSSGNCRYLRVAASGYNHGINQDAIVGGSIDTPPGILHSAETPEIRDFTQQMWNKHVPLPEAVERLNLLDGTQPDSVMDSFMYGTTNASAKAAEGRADVIRDTPQDEGQQADTGVRDEINAPSGAVGESGSCQGNAAASLQLVEKEKHKIEEVTGFTAPPEYIDEEQYLRETEGNLRTSHMAAEPMPDESDDDEHHTGIEEVNYSALTENERQLVLTLMHGKLEDPESHEEILKELLAGDTGGLTEEQCRAYFDKFLRIGDILIALNKTVLMNPLQTDWIPELQQRIRGFVSGRGHEVASIRWTEDDVIVALKDVVTETRSADLHEALAAYLRNDAGTDLCPGIKNVGLLLYTATPEESDDENNTRNAVKGGRKGKSKRNGSGVY